MWRLSIGENRSLSAGLPASMTRCFEASLGRRQYDAVDPDNRLVVGELERRWNERLKEERRLQEELDAVSVAHGRNDCVRLCGQKRDEIVSR